MKPNPLSVPEALHATHGLATKEMLVVNNPPDHSEGSGSAYRLYLLGPEGRIDTSGTVVAEGDGDAIQQAKAVVHSHAVELWDRSRLVIRLPRLRQPSE